MSISIYHAIFDNVERFDITALIGLVRDTGFREVCENEKGTRFIRTKAFISSHLYVVP